MKDLAAGPDTLAVIHATITLVQNLGKCSVAEGVETAEQLAILQSLGCHYAQGYFLGYPLPEAATSLGISLPAAKSRLHRAMQGLRRTLTTDVPPVPSPQGGTTA